MRRAASKDIGTRDREFDPEGRVVIVKADSEDLADPRIRYFSDEGLV